MIYVDLRGRIGNQLFIYAFAEALRQSRGSNEMIIFYDYSIKEANWINSLEDYHLENVDFKHDQNYPFCVKLKRLVLRLFFHFVSLDDYTLLAKMEKKFQFIFSVLGIIVYHNGYMNIPKTNKKNIYVMGYFQSPMFFESINKKIVNKLRLDSQIDSLNSNTISLIKERNSVCISIKVEHNVGNPVYDVCGGDYWGKAIQYIINRVDNPLFFICSDNVEYVKQHLIDTTKYNTICQDKNLPVHISLAIMGLCKHFIIGNTSFGWWAQHISDNPSKIVIAPKPWVRNDIPIDIYEENMHLIDVNDYILSVKK